MTAVILLIPTLRGAITAQLECPADGLHRRPAGRLGGKEPPHQIGLRGRGARGDGRPRALLLDGNIGHGTDVGVRVGRGLQPTRVGPFAPQGAV